MTDEEKKELAKQLFPHLAWDLSRVGVWQFTHHPNSSPAMGEMFINEIILQLRAKIHQGESFTIAIAPEIK